MNNEINFKADEIMDSPNPQKSATVARRHDLDALRAVAMLLGIGLHAAVSFTSIPWSVHDTQKSELLEVFFAFLHGFRMPLFFLISGYFTAMLWRKRGLGNLLKHRFKRIFLPLVIGMFTIIPAMWASFFVTSLPAPGSPESSDLFIAVHSADKTEIKKILDTDPSALNQLDPQQQTTPLCLAVFLGHTDIVETLIKAGADVNMTDDQNATPLHVAAFVGRADEAKLLIDAGAKTGIVDANGQTPRANLKVDFGTTNFICSSLGLPLEEKKLKEERRKIADLLGESEFLGSKSQTESESNSNALYGLLFQFPVFMHLWFLWFLCWFVIFFPLFAFLFSKISLPSWVTSSPLCLLILIPLTMIPESFMAAGTVGADSSPGFLPLPSVLAYYAVYFFFGAIYWDGKDEANRLSKHWLPILLLAILVVFPICFDVATGKYGWFTIQDTAVNSIVNVFLQATFAWLMIVGLMGLFQRFFSAKSKTLRYLSDASYWLYLAHLPLVIIAQWLVKEYSIDPILKFSFITVSVSILLLISYQLFVRYSFIGRILNGPRKPN